MIRNSIHTFNSRAETGIDKIPLFSIVQVIDSDRDTITPAGTNFSALVQIIDKTGFDATTTVGDFLDTPGSYRDLVQSDIGGRTWEDLTETLSGGYKVGDIITGNGTEGVLGVTYTCQTLPAAPGTFDILEWSLTGLSVLENFAPDAAASFPVLHGGLTIREGAAFRVSDITLGNLVGTQTVAVGDMIIALKDAPIALADFNFMPGAGSASGTQVPEDFITTATGDYPVTYNGLPIQAGASWIVRDVTASNRIGGPTGFPLNVGDVFTALVDLPAGAGTPGGPTTDWSTSAGVEPDIVSFSATGASTAGDYPEAGTSVTMLGASSGPGIMAAPIQRIRAGTVFVTTDADLGAYVGTKRIRSTTRITAKVDSPKISGFTGTEETDQWSVESLPVAGEPWNALFSYNPGETVTLVDNAYVALIATTVGDVPGTVPLQWRPTERSGRLWNAAYNYLAGDTAVFGTILYLALIDSANAQPDAAPTSWQNIQTTRYNVGTFTPDDTTLGGYDAAVPGSSSEYPDTSDSLGDGTNIVASEGAVWYADGLPGPSAPIPGYLITEGPLAGKTVHNGDQYVLVGTTPDVWYAEASPRVSGERAGLAWASHLDYYAGDIVSEAGLAYMAIADMVAGSSSSPAATPAEWTALDVYGRAWNDRTAYVIGDQVSYGNETYVCTVTGPSSYPGDVILPALLGDWKVTSQGRGIEWIATETYVKGDTVSYLTEVYTALGNTTPGGQPADTPAEWKITSAGEGMLWLGTISYKIGDVVTLNGTAYVAKIDNININPQTSTAAQIDTNWSPHFSGLHKTPLEPAGGITTSLVNNLKNILRTTENWGAGGFNLTTIGETGDFISIDSTLHNPLDLKNNTAIRAYDAAAGIVNLVSRTGTEPNTPPATGALGTYNEEVILGDGGIVSAIRSVTGSEPVIRHGGFGTTDDFRIVHEGNIADYEKGGVVWDPTIQYEIGDVVSIGDELYIIGEDPTNVGNPPPAGTLPGDLEWSADPIGSEVGGIAYDGTAIYVDGDVVSQAGVLYIKVGIPNTMAPAVGGNAEWVENNLTVINTTYASTVVYENGDIVTVGDQLYVVTDDTIVVVGDTPPSAGWSLVDTERGGVLHNATSFAYKVGDTATIIGDTFLYHCILDHTSAATCVGDATNWRQPPAPGYAPVTYNYTSDILGAIPPAAPTTGNGPHYFTVATGSAGRSAQVWVEGFELKFDEFDTALDGYVEILVYVSDNSWVKIVI